VRPVGLRNVVSHVLMLTMKVEIYNLRELRPLLVCHESGPVGDPFGREVPSLRDFNRSSFPSDFVKFSGGFILPAKSDS